MTDRRLVTSLANTSNMWPLSVLFVLGSPSAVLQCNLNPAEDRTPPLD